MTYKTIEVPVTMDLEPWSDQELQEEMEHRGYYMAGSPGEDFLREDYDLLLELIDRQPFSWELNRVREKLHAARHG